MSTEADDPLAELVARCVVAYEQDGQPAVEELLAASPQLAAAAQQQLQALGAAGLLLAPERPTRIGPYAVLQRLGTGGMGTVWLCAQEAPIRRRLAVKLIRPGMNSGELLRRFRVEQQALAVLEHPHIARVLDAGSTADGRPFLAMDYVPGVPLTRYCDERQLSVRDRVQLLLPVCDAVQHAHQKGILHRDLKPSNVLVTDRDGMPFPVVIDFGVAKATSGALPDATLLTRPGHLVGTPEYMSPEQAAPDLDVDTRTDVYSLGVILYELLTGTLPIAREQLRPGGDVARALHDIEPPTPSTRMAHLGVQAQAIAHNRRTNPTALRRAVLGDLDWIVLKALEKDRNRRYGMPAELAADLRRHLADEPVLAGRPGAGHRLRKFCRRHRLQVVAGLTVFASLLAGLIATALSWREAAAAERTSRASLQHVDQSLGTALAAVDRIVVLGADGLQALPQSEALRSQLLQEALDLHERLIASGDGGEPRQVASLAAALARAARLQFLLGRPEPARALLERAERTAAPLTARHELAPPVRAQLARALYLCGEQRTAQGEPAAAIALYEQTLAVWGAVLAADPGDREARCGRLQALRQLGDHRSDTDVERARSLLQEALPEARALLADDGHDPETRLAGLAILVRLGWLQGETGRPQEALELTRSAHAALHAAAAGDAEPRLRLGLGALMTDLANSELRFGDYAPARASSTAAIALLREAMAAQPAILVHRAQLAHALELHAMLHDDVLSLAEWDRLRRESLQLEEQCYERSGHSPDRGDYFMARLLGYASELVDLASERGRDAVDLAFAQQCLDRATAIHDGLPAAYMQDRHTRESWLQSFVLRAGLQRLRGDHGAARATLLAGVDDAESLVRAHPDVVQLHKIASELHFDLVRELVQLGGTTDAWAHLLAAHRHLVPVHDKTPVEAAHWRRLQPTLHLAAASLAGSPPPPSLAADDLAFLATDCATCGAAAEKAHAGSGTVILGFGRELLAAARARGLSAERAAAAALAPLRD